MRRFSAALHQRERIQLVGAGGLSWVLLNKNKNSYNNKNNNKYRVRSRLSSHCDFNFEAGSGWIICCVKRPSLSSYRAAETLDPYIIHPECKVTDIHFSAVTRQLRLLQSTNNFFFYLKIQWLLCQKQGMLFFLSDRSSETKVLCSLKCSFFFF